MATGELVKKQAGLALRERPVGAEGDADQPLTPAQREFLDQVIASAEKATGLRFSVYIGPLGGADADTRAAAEELHDALGADTPYAVLLAVSPDQRVVEVVTGSIAARRLTDRGARLGVLNVVSRITEGDVQGALINGIRTLADQAGILPERVTW